MADNKEFWSNWKSPNPTPTRDVSFDGTFHELKMITGSYWVLGLTMDDTESNKATVSLIDVRSGSIVVAHRISAPSSLKAIAFYEQSEQELRLLYQYCSTPADEDDESSVGKFKMELFQILLEKTGDIVEAQFRKMKEIEPDVEFEIDELFIHDKSLVIGRGYTPWKFCFTWSLETGESFYESLSDDLGVKLSVVQDWILFLVGNDEESTYNLRTCTPSQWLNMIKNGGPSIINEVVWPSYQITPWDRKDTSFAIDPQNPDVLQVTWTTKDEEDNMALLTVNLQREIQRDGKTCTLRETKPPTTLLEAKDYGLISVRFADKCQTFSWPVQDDDNGGNSYRVHVAGIDAPSSSRVLLPDVGEWGLTLLDDKLGWVMTSRATTTTDTYKVAWY